MLQPKKSNNIYRGSFIKTPKGKKEKYNYPDSYDGEREYVDIRTPNITTGKQVKEQGNKGMVLNETFTPTRLRKKLTNVENYLKPQGVIIPNQELKVDLDIKQRAQIPKYYNITDKVNQNFGGTETNYKYYPENGDLPQLSQEKYDDGTPYNSRTITPQYAMGGNLNTNMTRYAQGGDLTQFNEGGLHENNPNGGVMIGNNNSVEQGETKQDNFVYSNRIILDSNIVSQYNLPKSLVGKSVADATKLIDNKFKGRNDKISQSTKESMLSKIAEAQEAMKPQEPEPQMDPNMIEQSMDQNQMFLGGDLDETKLEPYMGSIKQGTGAISSILSGDRDGAVNGVIGGGLSAAGTAIGGPIGGMIGSALAAPISGAINGLLNKGKLEQERKDQHVRDVSKNVNDFALGGVLPKPLIADEFVSPTSTEGIKKYQASKGLPQSGVARKLTNAQYALDKANYTPNTPPNIPNLNKNFVETTTIGERRDPAGPNFSNNFTAEQGPLQGSLLDNLEANYQAGLTPEMRKAMNKQALLNQRKKLNGSNNSTNFDSSKINLNKIGDSIGQAARYAPIAMNAYQLSQLKKADVESLNRLDKRYTPEYVDEKQLQNIANSELNNVSNSLTSATNGSIGDLRNNLLGASLNRGKTLSNAYMDANNQNRATNDKAQLFNAEQDIRNQQIDTQEKDINARNQAAYRNAKREYITGIGEGIGNVGNEQAYKKIAITTTGYNWLGEFQKMNPNATKEETIIAAKKAGVVLDDKKALGGYLIKNKVK